MIGRVEAQQPMTFTSRIGSADNEKHKVEVMVTEPLRTPMVVRDDGATFSLTWEDILQLAAAAFEEYDASSLKSG